MSAQIRIEQDHVLRCLRATAVGGNYCRRQNIQVIKSTKLGVELAVDQRDGRNIAIVRSLQLVWWLIVQKEGSPPPEFEPTSLPSIVTTNRSMYPLPLLCSALHLRYSNTLYGIQQAKFTGTALILNPTVQFARELPVVDTHLCVPPSAPS